jgi:hypothetical protein
MWPSPFCFGMQYTLCNNKQIAEFNYIQKNILINFSKTIGPMGTKPGMNDHWMVPYKEFVFFVDQKYTKETRGPKVSKMMD